MDFLDRELMRISGRKHPHHISTTQCYNRMISPNGTWNTQGLYRAHNKLNPLYMVIMSNGYKLKAGKAGSIGDNSVVVENTNTLHYNKIHLKT